MHSTTLLVAALALVVVIATPAAAAFNKEAVDITKRSLSTLLDVAFVSVGAPPAACSPPRAPPPAARFLAFTTHSNSCARRPPDFTKFAVSAGILNVSSAEQVQEWLWHQQTTGRVGFQVRGWSGCRVVVVVPLLLAVVVVVVLLLMVVVVVVPLLLLPLVLTRPCSWI